MRSIASFRHNNLPGGFTHHVGIASCSKNRAVSGCQNNTFIFPDARYKGQIAFCCFSHPMMRHMTYYDRNKRGKKRNRYDQSKRHRLAVDRTEPMVGRILRNRVSGMQAAILLLHKCGNAPSAHHILINGDLLPADIYAIAVHTMNTVSLQSSQRRKVK